MKRLLLAHFKAQNDKVSYDCGCDAKYPMLCRGGIYIHLYVATKLERQLCFR